MNLKSIISISLNVNGIKTPIIRQKLPERIKKAILYYMLSIKILNKTQMN
jgi:hypothetical protein